MFSFICAFVCVCEWVHECLRGVLYVYVCVRVHAERHTGHSLLVHASRCTLQFLACSQVLSLDGRKKTYYYTLPIPTAAPSIALAVG